MKGLKFYSSIKNYVPKNIRLKLKQAYLSLKYLKYIGNNHRCPFCGGYLRKFLTYGAQKRANVACPRDYSTDRHRLIWFYLKYKTNFFHGNLKVLHFAPQYCFQKITKKLPNLDYISADLHNPDVTVKMDIQDIKFNNNYFDIIICSHVLEHVFNDRKAIKELYRGLKPGGKAIILVPIDHSREKTYEDVKITKPEDRLRYFGQKDHVRLYGRDFIERLEQAGFSVHVEKYATDLGREITKIYGLNDQEEIFSCIKHN